MAEEKNYRASTGVDEFYYGVLDEATNKTSGVERVKFLQSITVEMPQEPVRAYGDNITAELAVSSGNTSVTSGFHKVPKQDKKVLFGLEEKDGLIAYGSEDTPPYVAVIFAKTYEDGSKEWVGLPKGMFMRSNITGQTNGDGGPKKREDGSFAIRPEDERAFRKKQDELFDEPFIIDVGDNYVTLETVKDIVLEYDEEVSGNTAVAYDYLCEAFENMKAKGE